MQQTISYSDRAKGWTCFLPYFPNLMGRLNSEFFSLKEGQLWIHNDESNPVRNNFYGIQYSSKITTVLNDASWQDNIFKNLVLESNSAWDAKIKTNLSEGTLKSTEFNKKESRYFAFLRKNEDETNFHGGDIQGVGVISSVSLLNITYGFIPEFVGIGDKLYQANGDDNEFIGTITNISSNVITVDAITTIPVPGYFSFSRKNSRVEGAEIRGYYAEISLENSETKPVELFAISSNIINSYVRYE